MVQGPLSPTLTRLRPIGAEGVRVTGGFWSRLQDLNGSVMIVHAQDWMERLGWIANFDHAAAGELPEKRRGREFSDSDVYKLMEAMAWEHGRTGNPDMDSRFRALTARIVPVQEPDGYINTMFGRRGQEPRYTNFEFGHELYCMGHMIQASVARARTAGEDEFVRAARRAADHICLQFGAGGREKIPGHPVVEMALVELSRLTGEPKYLEQARLFVVRRGHGLLPDIEWGRSYYQDRIPVLETEAAEGHAVRAMYLAAGATDVAVDSNDPALLEALTTQALNTLARRTYITGGVGSRHQGESFGEDFELPSDRAYAETCAGIGAIQFFERQLLATRDVRFADAVERILFNVVAASPSRDGRAFFYSNPLQCRVQGEGPDLEHPSPRAESSLRAPWYEVSCCPTNVSRTLASFDSLIATQDLQGVQIQQYATSNVRASLAGGEVRMAIETNYPHEGRIRIRVEAAPSEWVLTVRVPQWAATDATFAGVPVAPGYASTPGPSAGEEVVLDLSLTPRWSWPDPRIDAVRGQVAVERGPLVYCLESIDLNADLGAVSVDTKVPLLDEGTSVTATVRERRVMSGDWPYGESATADEAVSSVRLHPYYDWGNRGATTMRVFIPASTAR